MIAQAAGEGATFIATPEGSNLLQRKRDLFVETAVEPERDVFVQGVRDLARRHGVDILIGSALVKRGDGLFANRSMLIDAMGEVTASYDKIHMFDVDLPTGERHRESNLYTPGDRAVAAEAAWGGLGLTICYDVRFPALYQALAQTGVTVITVPADRRGPLACAVAGSSHRDRRLYPGPGPRRIPRGRTWHLWPFARGHALGRGHRRA
jgi:predicted amidohydrolase